MKILELTLDELTLEFETKFSKGLFHASALYREIFKKGAPLPLEAKEFRNSPKLTPGLKKILNLHPGTITKTISEGNLTKFITRLPDGFEIESVVIPMARYNTLCVSSQVGCRMGCSFCETGKMGLKRNLTVEEITGQVYNARHTLKKEIKNIVFMGMGEPLDNFDAVIQAIQVINEPKGFDVALRHITISTAGIGSGIENLASLNWPQLRLAISINAPNDEIRSYLMPVNRRTSMQELKSILINYPLTKRGLFLMEYILIKGVNDSRNNALQLADFLSELPVRLNLIPCNPVKNLLFESPSDQEMNRFKRLLTDAGVFVIARWSKGRSVTAGCGQLGKQYHQL